LLIGILSGLFLTPFLRVLLEEIRIIQAGQAIGRRENDNNGN